MYLCCLLAIRDIFLWHDILFVLKVPLNDSGSPFRRSAIPEAARVNPNPYPDPRNGGTPEWGAGTQLNSKQANKNRLWGLE